MKTHSGETPNIRNGLQAI